MQAQRTWDAAEHAPSEDAPWFDDFFAAHAKATELRAQAGDDVVVRVERSPYSGYVVRSISVDLFGEPELRLMLRGGARYETL